MDEVIAYDLLHAVIVIHLLSKSLLLLLLVFLFTFNGSGSGSCSQRSNKWRHSAIDIIIITITITACSVLFCHHQFSLTFDLVCLAMPWIGCVIVCWSSLID
eukprot:scaffold3829_cov188-Ochromonas_danica.AAC.3